MANPKNTAFRNRVRFLLLGMILLGYQRVEAQNLPVQPDSLADKDFLKTEHVPQGIDILASPKRTRLSPLAKGAAVLVAGTGIWTATFALADEPLQQYTQRHRSTAADKISYVVQPLGRQGFMVPVVGVAFAGGLLLKDSQLQKAGFVSMGSILISSGLTSMLKNQIHRHRPSATTENHIFDWAISTSDNTSLPSAHTATAFAVATSVATVYGYENRYVPPIAYGIATLVGLSRVNDNAHWATDVMAGAMVGYISAKGTIYLYDMVNQKLKIRKQRLLINPQLGTQSGGLSATLVF